MNDQLPEGEFFEHQGLKLHYHKFGNGTKYLLALHGYGQNGYFFKPLAEALEEYTVLAPDLFFHGYSHYPDADHPLEKRRWEALILQLLKHLKIESFSICGFSMGGKFMLSLLENMPHRVNKVLLIAPDGITTNFWYNMATYPAVFRGFFRRTVTRPNPFFGLVSTLNKLKVVDRGVLKFAKTQMKSRAMRLKVYYSWVVYRHFQFDMEAIAGIINLHKIPTVVVLGIYDKIITEDNMQELLKRLHHYRLIKLKEGHNHLIEATARFLLKEQFL